VDDVFVSEVYGTVCGKNFERGVSLMETYKSLGRCLFCLCLFSADIHLCRLCSCKRNTRVQWKLWFGRLLTEPSKSYESTWSAVFHWFTCLPCPPPCTSCCDAVRIL